MSQIRSTVQKAIDASRPEAGTQISESRQAVADVSESQNGYCDTSAAHDLVLGQYTTARHGVSGTDGAAVPGDADRLGIWIPRGENLPKGQRVFGVDGIGPTDPSAYVKDRLVVCERFGRDVLIPIAKVFKVGSPDAGRAGWRLT